MDVGKYKAIRLLIDDYRKLTAEELRDKFDPLYKTYWTDVLAQKIGCNPETIHHYRKRTNPRKPTFENYLLLRALLEEDKKT